MPVLILVITLAFVLGAATNARADYNVVISAATSTLGSWSGNVWTPNASGSTVSAVDIETKLGTGPVTIQTSGGGAEAGDINVNEPVSWSANTLTLTAANNVNINSLLTAGGTSVLVITNPGLNVSGRVDFPGRSGTGILSINSTDYTVIDSLTDLQGMSGDLAGNYALGANIDATATSGWNAGAGFLPVGNATNYPSNSFTGSFDGLGHTIDHLSINRSATNYVGLFGYSDGTISNVGLTNVTVSGGNYVGGLAGVSDGTVSNSYVTGAVSGTGSVGGLAGENAGTVINSYATGTVNGSGGADVGGLVGKNIYRVFNSHAAGTVSSTGGAEVGGLAGYSSGQVINSYATASVSGIDYLGGLVGRNAGTGSEVTSYATGAVSGSGGNVGGLVGWNDSSCSVSNSYWDTDTTGRANGIGAGSGTATIVTGMTTSALMTQATYTTFDFTNTWWMVDGSTRPLLRSEWSLVIKNGHQLQMMDLDLTAHYVLGNDIDLSGVLSNTTGTNGTSSALWGGAGFVPVGNNSIHFTGSFDGQGHAIDGLFINRSATNFVGLFSVINGTISNVGLTNVTVSGSLDVGGLVGESYGTVSNSYVTGTVSGGSDVGGLVGEEYSGTVNNCYATASVSGSTSVGGLVGEEYSGAVSTSYATGTVTGSSSVGGLVGSNLGAVSNSYATGAVSGGNTVGGLVGYNNGTVSNSYATGAVSGSDVGGLVGENSAAGTITNVYATGASNGTCLIGWSENSTITNGYWNTETCTAPGGGLQGTGTFTNVTGLTTAQMQTLSSFTGWNIDDAGNTGKTWRIYEGHTYPLLRSFLTPLTVTADNVSKTYDGLPYTAPLANPVFSIVNADSLGHLFNTSNPYDSAIDAGTYPPALYSDQQGYDVSYVDGTLTINSLNGACGSDNGLTLTAAPTNLCASGTPSAVSGTGPWTWICYGVSGGTDASCSATINPLNGVCGIDNGQLLSTTPTNLCANGTPSAVSGTGPWTWTCYGASGGSDTSCSAQLMPSGDLNNDGKVDIADALEALRIASGIDTATAANLANGDVAPLVGGVPNPDGTINTGDVIVILRKAVGLITW